MLEGYITPLLMSYVDKYVKNLKPSDLQVSFWGGDAVLRNLELRLDVLERELSYPLEFKSGKIRELVIHIPWNAIVSKAVEVTIKDIEFVVKLKDIRAHSAQNPRNGPSARESESADAAASVSQTTDSSNSQQASEQTPGYLQGYLSRISNNVQFHVLNMVVKVIEEECDMMLTLNFGSVEIYATDENWNKAFIYTDYLQGDYTLNNVCEFSDLVVNLHPIESSGQTDSSKEPFVQRCSFTCRTKSEHRGNALVKKTRNILFDSIEFSADEKQFCLFMHFLDWILAMYYSSKRLKGRDDQPSAQSQPVPTSPLGASSEEGSGSQSSMFSSAASEEQSEESHTPAGAEADDAQTYGWGAWMWSFVGADSAPESKPETDSSAARNVDLPCSIFAIFAKTITFNFKVAHRVQIPVFYSVKFFSRPVLSISFTGCMFQLDRVPATQLFLVSIGFMSIQGDITGFCPCEKKLPSSWGAGGTGATDSTDWIHVLSIGIDSSECDLREIQRGTLFEEGTGTDQPATIPEDLLKERKELFSALWFSYEYYDVGPTRQTEELMEIFNLGWVNVAVSPDVLHRLRHFHHAYSQSLEVNPLFSEGMVVIGDPKAETIVKFFFAGGQALLTTKGHYLPVTGSDNKPHKPQKSSSQRKQPIPELPSVCVVIAESSINFTRPMYRGNATEEIAHKNHMRMNICDIRAGVCLIRELAIGDSFSKSEQFLHIPNLEINQHSKTYGEEGKDTSYIQLDVEETSSTFSLTQLSKLFFLLASWKSDFSPPVAQFRHVLSSPNGELGHLHLSLRNVTVTKSVSEQFTFLSVVLGDFSGAIVHDMGMEKLGHMIPVLYGPFNTEQWNETQLYKQPKKATAGLHERLAELFVATPCEDLKEERFPAVQLLVSGFAVSMDPALLDFMRHLPTNVLTTPQQGSGYEPAGPPPLPPPLPQPQGDLHSSGVSAVTPRSLSPPATPTADVPPEANAEEMEDKKDFFATLRHYAVKVKIHPILLIMPVESHAAVDTASEDGSNLPHNFPILPTLDASTNDSHSQPSAAVLLSLPQVTVESAKSHVLDEPVPKNSRKDTFPWDCILSRLSLFTVANHRAYYILEPTAVKVALASQQDGTGITIHADTIAFSVSEKQALLLSHTVFSIMDTIAPLCSSPPSLEEAIDSGIVSSFAHTPVYPPSILSSPAHSTVTITTLPAPSESTVSSFIYPGFSSLWVQVIVSKLAFNFYGTQTKQVETDWDLFSSSSFYGTPLTSPSGSTQVEASESCLSDISTVLSTKLLVEFDGISLQVDAQEKGTDVVLKVSSVESLYFKKEETWKALLPSEKLLSSSTSALPDELSHLVTQSVSSVSQIHLPVQAGGSSGPKMHRSFIFLEAKVPRNQPHKVTKIRLTVQPFELVIWFPAICSVQNIVTAALPPNTAQGKSSSREQTVTNSWPAVEVNLECFRIVLPNYDYSSILLFSLSGLHITSTLDYPGSDIRFITNSSTFRRLSLLSSEKKIPSLPAYQLDAFSISLWGIRRPKPFWSTRVLLFASRADLRVVYTPALYWSPQIAGFSSNLPKSKPATLACGHYLEVSLTTDVNFMIGSEQVACVCNILKSNKLILERSGTDEDELPVTECTSDLEVPIKVLFTGRVVTATLLTDSAAVTCDQVFESSSDQSDLSLALQPERGAAPLLQVSFYNPLCSFQSDSEDTKCEISCFNIAAIHTEEPTPLSYAELLDMQSVLASLNYPLLETRKGQLDDESRIPASILTVNWTSSCNTPPAFAVDIGRPIKLSFTPFLAKELKNLIRDLSVVTSSHQNDTRRMADSGKQTYEQVDGNKLATAKEIKLTTAQVLVELRISALTSNSNLSTSSVIEMGPSEPSLVFPDDSSVLDATVATREGVLIAWDSLDVAYPHGTLQATANGSSITGDFHVSGLQLLTIAEGFTNPLALPSELSCLFCQHLPCSELDLPQTAVNLSSGLLHFRTSKSDLTLLQKAINCVSEVTSSGKKEEDNPPPPPQKSGGSITHFKDDLRTGDFKYITDSSGTGTGTPLPGEILFYLGSPDSVATMTWQYCEPRAITFLNVLPVPFSVTAEDDVPVDIKVGCTLECWSEDAVSFTALEQFHVSESSSTEVVVRKPLPSRKWRISIMDVEWVDEEEGESFVSKANVLDDSGSPLPISSILSPLSLAASTRVDSYFTPAFIPSLSISLHCQEMQATLLHTPTPEGCVFKGYSITQSGPPQATELLRVNISSFNGQINQMRDAGMSLQLYSSVSLEFVDYGNLTWRTAIYSTNLHANINRGGGIRNKLPVQSDAQNVELEVDLKSSPAVVRLSQGLLHTLSLALYTWKSEKDADIFNHYILCNDTIFDLHIGQVSTDEDIVLPSNSCMGYSWRSHKTLSQLTPYKESSGGVVRQGLQLLVECSFMPLHLAHELLQTLHACLVTDGAWRWTKPFSIGSSGVETVQVYFGRHTATLYVQVTAIGGLQKQVSLFGSWKFSSTLPFDLELQLVATDQVQHSLPFMERLKAGGSLPSLLAADSQVAGVMARLPGAASWSKVYPLSATAHEWNKPQLLAEIETADGRMLHCWYNIKPMDSTSEGTWGNKITFAPLFTVCNHLPFDLPLSASAINADGVTQPILNCTIPGKGQNTELCTLSADTWYHLKFKKCDSTAISEPPIAVSTYLLLHLPFSAPLASANNGWPYDSMTSDSQVSNATKGHPPIFTVITLPLEDGFYCSIHAALIRSSLNTIVVDLKPTVLVVNRCSLPIQLMEKFGDHEGEETRERETHLEPSGVGVTVQNQFVLGVFQGGLQFYSKSIRFPATITMDGNQPKEDLKKPLRVALTTADEQAFGEFFVTFCQHYGILIAVIKPVYILHNRTSLVLNVWSSLLDEKPLESITAASACVQQVPIQQSRPLIFWQKLPSQTGSMHALSLSSTEDDNRWSILLSPNFVRRSFSLPTDNPKQPFVPALLTMHEYQDITYLVVAHDPSPGLQIQNLCGTAVEVVESGSKAIHACSQVIPPGCHIVYEPPTLATLYPMVYDEDIASSPEKAAWKASKLVSIVFRASVTEGDIESWSEAVTLTSDKDKILDIPGMGIALISTHSQGNVLFISILPTGNVPPLQPVGELLPASPSPSSALKFDCKLAQTIVCLDDEASDTYHVHEVLRIIGDKAEFHYSTSSREGAKIDFTLQTLHIDNMLECSTAEYAVTLLPRTEHAARPKLVQCDPPPLIKLLVHYNPHTPNMIDRLYICIQPVTIQLEDSLLQTLRKFAGSYSLPGTLTTDTALAGEDLLILPTAVQQEAERDASPLIISSLVIGPTAFYLNARISFKVLLSCSDSPFRFLRYELVNIYSNWQEVSQTIASRYFTTIIMHTGWLLGSLELIGSPGAFIQSVGRGLRDLVSLPYEGLTRSPSLFIVGIGRGTAAFMHQFSAGALRSVTNLASSIARNMERLSMDPHHISYQDQMRREQPVTHFTSGLATGVSSFGLSLMSAIAGIVEQPMQSIQQMEGSPTALGATRSVLAGVGKGLIGAVAKPVGGAMDLVSQTGQGIMHGTGLAQKLTHKEIEMESFTGQFQKIDMMTTASRCAKKVENGDHLLIAVPVTHLSSTGVHHSAILLLTPEGLHILDCDSDTVQQNFRVDQCSLLERGSTQLDEVELHLTSRSLASGSQTEFPEFKPVEYYLQVSQSHELVISPQKKPEIKQEVEGGTTLLVKTHHAAQLLSIYHSLVQCILHPNIAFCIHASVSEAIHSESFFSASSRFHS